MVVRRAVKLAHIVCAVFSLSRPRGVTRSQIYKYCTLNFHIRKDRRQFYRALQRAEDEDLVSCFQQRYRLGTTGRGSDILWAQKSRRHQGHQRKRPRAGAKLPSARVCRKRAEVKRARAQRNQTTRTSSCCPCNLKKRREEDMRRRKCKKNRSRLRTTRVKRFKGVILCKSFSSYKKRKTHPRRTAQRMSSRTRNKREVEVDKLKQKKKSSVRSRREHRGKRKVVKSSKQTRYKINKRNNTKSKKSSQKRSRRDVYREALRRPTRTVAHAESWDRINYSRRRSELENKKLMKESKMVQRILSGRHGPSWDDLNKELRRIKSARSCEVGDAQTPAKKRRS